MPKILEDTCTCQYPIEYSYVINSRYRWNKKYKNYQKYRRRQCFECNGRFSTIEINYKKFQDLTKKAKKFEDLIDKTEKIQKIIKNETELTGQKDLSIQKEKFDNLINNL